VPVRQLGPDIGDTIPSRICRISSDRSIVKERPMRTSAARPRKFEITLGLYVRDGSTYVRKVEGQSTNMSVRREVIFIPLFDLYETGI
jgi:hypothetical protein